MPNYFTLTLDTTGPSNPSIRLDNNAQFATNTLVTASISTGDSDKTGYQMKIWGDLDLAWAKSNGLVGTNSTVISEETASWVTFAASKQLKLSGSDGAKTVSVQIRDDVYNVSAVASDSITLDTTRPNCHDYRAGRFQDFETSWKKCRCLLLYRGYRFRGI